MNPLYIITARGGSKGIPGKNIKPLAGRPLIAYTIQTALQLAEPQRVILSTDSEQIAAVARLERLPVNYMRPASLGGDNVGSQEVILDAMNWADAQSIAYDCVVLLQPTSPLRTTDDVERCLQAYAASPRADMAVTVTQADDNPYYNLFETNPDGTLCISKGDGLIKRRQDAPPVWKYNGAVYVFNPQSLRTTPMGEMRRRIPSPMPANRSIDLDTPLDWLIAEAIMSGDTN